MPPAPAVARPLSFADTPAAAEGQDPAAAHGRIPEIEALRGVAILMVFLEHLPFNLITWPSRLLKFLSSDWRGAAGVDLFFAISGFVIARSLLPQLQHARAHGTVGPTLAAFWTRRAFRLLPAAWLWLLVPLVISALLTAPLTFGTAHANAHAALFPLANVQNIRFAFVPTPTIYTPYWSLSLEEQFYLLFPLIALLSGRALVVPMLALLVWQWIFPVGFLPNLTRPGSLAAGVLVALLHQSTLRARARPSWFATPWLGPVFLAASIAILGLMLSSLVTGNPPTRWGYQIGFGSVAVLSGALVHIAAYDSGLLLRAGAVRRMLEWVGARSYGLYLVHLTAYATLSEIKRRFLPAIPSKPAAAVLLVCGPLLAIVLAQLTYRWVEVPVRARGARLAARMLARARARAVPEGLT